MTQVSAAAYRQAAEAIGCTIPTIRAVFAVEAAGKFFERDGRLVSRFEPHHFPRAHWQALGFDPQHQAAWRASLKLKPAARRRMFDLASQIDLEAAYRATSWGAPQIMGFNHAKAGFASALEMVKAFERSADMQLLAFTHFVIAERLDTYLRASDWLSFAAAYNGEGQAEVYAARIETAFRAETGRKSPEILRRGARGDNVVLLQQHLSRAGYNVTQDGHFGDETDAALRRFQAEHGLAVDGMAGARTWKALRDAAFKTAPGTAPLPDPAPQRAEIERYGEMVIDKVGPIAAGGLGTGLLGGIDPTVQLVIACGVVLIAVAAFAVWAAPRLREAWR